MNVGDMDRLELRNAMDRVVASAISLGFGNIDLRLTIWSAPRATPGERSSIYTCNYGKWSNKSAVEVYEEYPNEFTGGDSDDIVETELLELELDEEETERRKVDANRKHNFWVRQQKMEPLS